MPLDGGDSRIEASFEGCVGRCLAVTDDTLYHSGGRDSDPDAFVVAVDLASGESNVLTTPWAASITVDDTTIYGASCYDAWSVPREGGEAFMHDFGGLLGCPSEMATDGETLYFNGDTVFRAPVDTLVPELLVEEGGVSFFVAREGVVFAVMDGAIVRIDDSGQQELAPAGQVSGIAVEGDDLYWLGEDSDGLLTVEHLWL